MQCIGPPGSKCNGEVPICAFGDEVLPGTKVDAKCAEDPMENCIYKQGCFEYQGQKTLSGFCDPWIKPLPTF